MSWRGRNRVVAHQIDTLFHGQLHKNPLISFALADHFQFLAQGTVEIKRKYKVCKNREALLYSSRFMSKYLTPACTRSLGEIFSYLPGKIMDVYN